MITKTITNDQHPVWLLSMDSEQFYAAPTTTAGLKAYYHQHGQHIDEYAIELLHFRDAESINQWQQSWNIECNDNLLGQAHEALNKGLRPILGFSFYTWNAAEFLSIIHALKKRLPDICIIAGGPHVQQVEDYLGIDPIDILFIGEAERSFTELLDAQNTSLTHIAGLAMLDKQGNIVITHERQRIQDLSEIPSPLTVLPLSDSDGKPLYESISYETSRGCPYKCAFCEWGTGAIGTKMLQFPLQRVFDDWEAIIASGIENIWLADSNFGALKDDLAKTQFICDLKSRHDLPRTFATSWSKKHSSRTQEMVLLLNESGLLPHYQLALQTLTPLALELSNRKNMDSNKYQRIAKDMAAANVPIAAELIWGLPGDNLNDFEINLDTLLAIFPNINIFAYTLLPGTEFYEKREEYQIKAIPVAGYGKAKGEYVVGSFSFSQTEGIEGYYLITAHILLIHGHLLPLTIRYLALDGSIPVSPMLREILTQLLLFISPQMPELNMNDKMVVYEQRDAIYLKLFSRFMEVQQLIARTVSRWLHKHHASNDVMTHSMKNLQLDSVLCPMPGPKSISQYHFPFQARQVIKALDAMQLPESIFYTGEETISITTPGGIGEVLMDPNGGSWLKGQIIEEQSQSLALEIS